MYLAYKYKLLPTKSQTQMLDQWEGSTRWLWNQFLAATKAQHSINKKLIWGFELKKQIPILKQQNGWLKQVPAHALQNVAFDINQSLNRSTGKNRDQGFPKFKCKGRNRGAIKIDQVGTHIKTSSTHITIPKLGAVRWKYHRPISGVLKQISLTKDISDWYVSVVCEIPDVAPIVEVDKRKTIGIDLGITSFATLSDGTKIDSPKFYKKQLKKLKYQQRRLKNKCKNSSNKKKQCDRIAKLHKKIRSQRLDWLHKLSHKLVEKYSVICVEDLKIKELLQKKQLSRSIADQGWGIFINQLQYKTRLKGKHLTKINTFLPSTKTCSTCSSTKLMKLSDRVYICENKGCADYLRAKDRDHNAAINIHIWGLLATPNITLYTPGIGGINACRDTNTQASKGEVSVKQEAACSLEPR